MITLEQLQDSMSSGANVLSEEGAVLGTIEQLHIDDTSGDPRWVVVTPHVIGLPSYFAPLQNAILRDNTVVLPYAQATVQNSPMPSQGDHLLPEEEQQLLRYYSHAATRDTPVDPAADTIPDSIASSSGDDDAVMIRSEEQLLVGTEIHETERVRLVKRVITEDVTMTVQIRREELVIERTAVTDGTTFYDDGETPYTDAERERLYDAVETAFNGDAVEVVLYEEKPRVEMDVVPIERIRLSRKAMTRDEVVEGQVRKEIIETELIEP